jgi:ribosome-associated heat shock protein Hsp15
MAAMAPTDTIRIDKLLWYLRLCKSRTMAQTWVSAGHMRVNGKRVEHTHQMIRVGDVITMPRGDTVITVMIQAIPPRRGPSGEAQKCYSFLTARNGE